MSSMFRRTLTGALSCIVIAFASCSRHEPIPKFSGDADFTFIHSESNFGNIEPCSCNNRTTGGFPRRSSALSEVRESRKDVLFVDSGNFLFSFDRKLGEPSFFAQMKLKAKYIAESFKAANVDAMVFGELDLAAGGDFFLETVRNAKLPMVVANAFDRESGKPLFEQYRIFDFNGLKVAVIGLVAEELHPTVSEVGVDGSMLIETNNKVTTILEDRFEQKNVKIEDPIKVAQDLMPEILSKAHLVAALTHLPPKLAQDLPSIVPGIQFVIGQHHPSSRAVFKVDPTTGAMFLGSSINGTGFGVADFRIRQGSMQLHDYSKLEVAKTLIPLIESWVTAIEDEYKNPDGSKKTAEQLTAIDERIGMRYVNLRAKLEYYKKFVAESDPETVSHFRHTPIQLDGKYRDDPKMKEIIARYRAELKSLYDPKNEARSQMVDRVEGAPHFVGDKVCTQCHRAQYDFWKGTKHGIAWQTMLNERVEYDLECIYCHTVGFMLPGGFDRPDRVTGFENVQCENCHGPGSSHLANVLSPRGVVNDIHDMQCERCHNNEHSPNFERITYVPRATCPPIDRWDPLIRGAIGKIRTDLERVMETKKDETPPHVYSGLLDVYLRLDRFEDAVAIAERGIVRHPHLKRSMILGMARALDAQGRTDDALQQLYTYYDELTKAPPANSEPAPEATGRGAKADTGDSTEAKVLSLICELLIRGRDPNARNLDMAKQFADHAIDSIDGPDGLFRVYRAEIDHDRGNLERAIEVLTAIRKNQDKKNDAFAEKLAAWRAERDALVETMNPPPLPVPPR